MKQKLLQIGRFLIGGHTAVLIYYAILYFLTEHMRVWYLLSSVIGFLGYVGINFYIQKNWVFKNSEKGMKTKAQIIRYFIMMIIFFVVNTILMYLLVEGLHLKYLLAQVFLTIFLSAISFVLTKKILSK